MRLNMYASRCKGVLFKLHMTTEAEESSALVVFATRHSRLSACCCWHRAHFRQGTVFAEEHFEAFWSRLKTSRYQTSAVAGRATVVSYKFMLTPDDEATCRQKCVTRTSFDHTA